MSEINKYRLALFCYYLSYIPVLKYFLNTQYGFCFYFNSYYFKNKFPILYSLKPINTWYNSDYWFEPGDLKSRIKCLKKAIKLCKDEVNK